MAASSEVRVTVVPVLDEAALDALVGAMRLRIRLAVNQAVAEAVQVSFVERANANAAGVE